MNKQLSFPRTHRLLTKAEYKSVFDQSMKVSGRHLLILFKPNKKSHARLGLMVGKRVANLAVARNQIKRAIRESFRVNQDKLKGFDLVVIARQQCDTLSKQKLRESIEKLWEKLLTSSP